MSLSDEQAQELKAKHGVVTELTLESGEVVYVKTPNVPNYTRFRAQAADEKKRESAVMNLVNSCLLHPPRAEFEAMVEARPALYDTVGIALMELAGLNQSVEKKAL